MKQKIMLMIALVIVVSSLWGCGSVMEEVPVIDDEGNLVYETDAPEETIEYKDIIEDSETEDNGDTRHYVGETVTFEANNGGEINVTLTDWGKVRDYLGNPVIYIKYMIENVGSETVTVGNLLFDLYADDYSVQGATVLSEDGVGDEVLGKDLSAGRKLEGVLYRDINPDNATVIEVECVGSVFVLKDESTANGSAIMLDGNSLDNVSIPSDMEIDSEPIESYRLSGYYSGMMGQSTISLSIYSSTEDEIGIGNADIYVEGGQYSYYGEIAELTTNVYIVAADTDDEVLLSASTWEDTIMLHLYVDGQLIEEYLMMEHYES